MEGGKQSQVKRKEKQSKKRTSRSVIGNVVEIVLLWGAPDRSQGLTSSLHLRNKNADHENMKALYVGREKKQSINP
jgi:hypothetical protein